MFAFPWGRLGTLEKLGRGLKQRDTAPDEAVRRGVDFGARGDRTDGIDATVRYANKRAEMWGYMTEWCKFGCLPDDRDLRADLTAVDYGYDASDAIQLERKDDMRRRGLASPDDGDALRLSGLLHRLGRRASHRRKAAAAQAICPVSHLLGVFMLFTSATGGAPGKDHPPYR
jgi:hypothetical protein